MAYDELELDTLGDQKTALFVILSDTDSTFNFVAALMYMFRSGGTHRSTAFLFAQTHGQQQRRRVLHDYCHAPVLSTCHV